MAHKEGVAIKRIAAEYKKSLKEDCYSIEWDDSNVFDCVVTLLGPPDTPYVLCSIEEWPLGDVFLNWYSFSFFTQFYTTRSRKREISTRHEFS